jgi:hypothetical protein
MKLLKTTTSSALGRGTVFSPPSPHYRYIMEIFATNDEAQKTITLTEEG